jgi:hypothetical protein
MARTRPRATWLSSRLAVPRAVPSTHRLSVRTSTAQVEKAVVDKCCLYCVTELLPMTALMGGVVAQEIVKMVTVPVAPRAAADDTSC